MIGKFMRPVRIFVWMTVWLALLAGACLSGFPRLEIIYPPSGRFECNSDKIPIIGKAACTNCSLFIGDYTIPMAADGSFQRDVPLKQGKNTIEIFLRDPSGNDYSKTLEITRNMPVPGGAVLDSPSAGALAPAAPPEVFASREKTRFNALYPAGNANLSVKRKPETAKTAVKKAVSVAMAVRSKEVGFFLNGKQAVSGSNDYVVKSNRIFMPADSVFWPEAGALKAGDTLIFNNGELLKQVVVSPNMPKAAGFRSKGKLYMPVRYVFESAGRQVNWTPGRVDIDNQYRPCPVDLGDMAKGGEDQIKGIIYKKILYVRAQDLIKLGIKVEKKSSGGLKLTSRSNKWVVIAKNANARQNKAPILELRNSKGKSPPAKIPAPGPIIADSRYSVPLRKVSSELGFDIKWEVSEKRASISPEVVASGRF
jgi:hypothetical protein